MSALLGTPFQLGQSIKFDYGDRDGIVTSPPRNLGHINRNFDVYQSGVQHDHRRAERKIHCSTTLAHGWLTYAPVTISCKSKRCTPQKSSAKAANSVDSHVHERGVPKLPIRCNQVTEAARTQLYAENFGMQEGSDGHISPYRIYLVPVSTACLLVFKQGQHLPLHSAFMLQHQNLKLLGRELTTNHSPPYSQVLRSL